MTRTTRSIRNWTIVVKMNKAGRSTYTVTDTQNGAKYLYSDCPMKNSFGNYTAMLRDLNVQNWEMN